MNRDFRPYVTWDREQLVGQLALVCTELAGLYEEIASVEAAAARAKVLGYANSQEPTVTGREREASFNAIDLTCTVIELKATVQALIEERDFVRLLI